MWTLVLGSDGIFKLLLGVSEEASRVVKVGTPESYNSYFCFSFTRKADTLGSVFPFELQCSRRKEQRKSWLKNLWNQLGEMRLPVSAFNLVLDRDAVCA